MSLLDVVILQSRLQQSNTTDRCAQPRRVAVIPSLMAGDSPVIPPCGSRARDLQSDEISHNHPGDRERERDGHGVFSDLFREPWPCHMPDPFDEPPHGTSPEEDENHQQCRIVVPRGDIITMEEIDTQVGAPAEGTQPTGQHSHRAGNPHPGDREHQAQPHTGTDEGNHAHDGPDGRAGSQRCSTIGKSGAVHVPEVHLPGKEDKSAHKEISFVRGSKEAQS